MNKKTSTITNKDINKIYAKHFKISNYPAAKPYHINSGYRFFKFTY